MATDNKYLKTKKQRYKVYNFDTNELLAEGFTSQKNAKEWIKNNRKENIHYIIKGF